MESHRKDKGDVTGGGRSVTSPRAFAKPVDEVGLRVASVRLPFLLCTAESGQGDKQRQAQIEFRDDGHGRLVSDSLVEDRFEAEVSWSVDGVDITVTGTHRLQFTVDKPIDEDDAHYYAEINAVILVYPYIRQIVDEMAVRAMGKNLLIRPLDVPEFMRTQLRRICLASAGSHEVSPGSLSVEDEGKLSGDAETPDHH
jgi:hypothetical protein